MPTLPYAHICMKTINSSGPVQAPVCRCVALLWLRQRWQVLRHVHAESLATTPPKPSPDPPKKKEKLGRELLQVLMKRTRRRTAEEIVRDCAKKHKRQTGRRHQAFAGRQRNMEKSPSKVVGVPGRHTFARRLAVSGLCPGVHRLKHICKDVFCPSGASFSSLSSLSEAEVPLSGGSQPRPCTLLSPPVVGSPPRPSKA